MTLYTDHPEPDVTGLDRRTYQVRELVAGMIVLIGARARWVHHITAPGPTSMRDTGWFLHWSDRPADWTWVGGGADLIVGYTAYGPAR